MKNDKGFTLMELIVAIFIGSMVTAALVLVWKTSSVQTSQGQRQTIVRNQVSNFQRQLYRDFYSADIITYPPINTNGTALLLAGIKKAQKINEFKFKVLQANEPAVFFAYCMGTGDEESVIKRYEETISFGTGNGEYNLSNYNDSKLERCRSNGSVILRDFSLTKSEIDAQGRYHIQGKIRKAFANAANSTPIKIDIDEVFTFRGGM